MSFRLRLPPTWTEIDLAHLAGSPSAVVFAAQRDAPDFRPSLGVTETVESTDVPLLRLLQGATGRAAVAVASAQVVDDRVLTDGPSSEPPLLRTLRLHPRPEPGDVQPAVAVLHYLLVAAGPVHDGRRTVVQFAATCTEDQHELIATDLEPMINSLSVVAGPPGRLP